MATSIIHLRGSKELAAVNTPECFGIDVGSNLEETDRLYLLESTLDPDQSDCDADGAKTQAILKKGEQSSTSAAVSAAGSIGPTRCEAKREAANIFRGSAPKVYQPSNPKLHEIPIVEGVGKLTLSIHQDTATALLAKVHYNIIVAKVSS